LTGFISKGIALCGKGHIPDARAAFDVASIYTNQDPQTVHFLLLIKVCYSGLVCSLSHCIFQAIALFNADQDDEAMLLLKELSAGCPNADTHACHVVEVNIMQQCLVVNADLCNS
jgi:hypothetical protein